MYFSFFEVEVKHWQSDQKDVARNLENMWNEELRNHKAESNTSMAASAAWRAIPRRSLSAIICSAIFHFQGFPHSIETGCFMCLRFKDCFPGRTHLIATTEKRSFYALYSGEVVKRPLMLKQRAPSVLSKDLVRPLLHSMMDVLFVWGNRMGC